MPSLGADMEAGTLAEWRVRPGDGVKRGDIVAVVDTEKAAIEVEIFEDGIVQAILVREGEKVPVGTVLAMIRNEGQPSSPFRRRKSRPRRLRHRLPGQPRLLESRRLRWRRYVGFECRRLRAEGRKSSACSSPQ
jgi:pyruvate dehydrogenase E2 component (dihydrolipoamide acetyltransferase)